jgi:hypothetical protein
MRNRVSAQLARERKRVQQLSKEQETQQLAYQTAELERRAAQLENENAVMRAVRRPFSRHSLR